MMITKLEKLANEKNELYTMCKKAIKDDRCSMKQMFDDMIGMGQQQQHEQLSHTVHNNGDSKIKIFGGKADLNKENNFMLQLFSSSIVNQTLNQFVQRSKKEISEELGVFQVRINEKIRLFSDKVTSVDEVCKEAHQSINQFSFRLLEKAESDSSDEMPTRESYSSYHDKACVNTCSNRTVEQIESMLERLSSIDTKTKCSNKPTDTKSGNSFHKIPSPKINFVTLDTGSLPTSYTVTNGNQARAQSQSTSDIVSDLIENIKRPPFVPVVSKKKRNCTRKFTNSFPQSCLEIKTSGATCDDVYVLLNKGLPMPVYCDLTHNGGGWLVGLPSKK